MDGWMIMKRRKERGKSGSTPPPEQTRLTVLWSVLAGVGLVLVLVLVLLGTGTDWC